MSDSDNAKVRLVLLANKRDLAEVNLRLALQSLRVEAAKVQR